MNTSTRERLLGTGVLAISGAAVSVARNATTALLLGDASRKDLVRAAVTGMAGGIAAALLGNGLRGVGARAQRVAFGAFEAGTGAFLTGFNRAGLRGATIAVAVSMLSREAFLGRRIFPKRTYGVFDGQEPVYRSGTRLWPRGSGVALGRTLVANRTGSPHYDHYLLAHETAHYQQQIDMGIARFYGRILLEYFRYGFRNTYHTPGTLEYAANEYARKHQAL